jgi:hypothetical protein
MVVLVIRVVGIRLQRAVKGLSGEDRGLILQIIDRESVEEEELLAQIEVRPVSVAAIRHLHRPHLQREERLRERLPTPELSLKLLFRAAESSLTSRPHRRRLGSRFSLVLVRKAETALTTRRESEREPPASSVRRARLEDPDRPNAFLMNIPSHARPGKPWQCPGESKERLPGRETVLPDGLDQYLF